MKMGKRRRANCLLRPGAVSYYQDIVLLIRMSDDCYSADSVLGLPSDPTTSVSSERWRNYSWSGDRRYSSGIVDWCSRSQ